MKAASNYTFNLNNPPFIVIRTIQPFNRIHHSKLVKSIVWVNTNYLITYFERSLLHKNLNVRSRNPVLIDDNLPAKKISSVNTIVFLE